MSTYAKQEYPLFGYTIIIPQKTPLSIGFHKTIMQKKHSKSGCFFIQLAEALRVHQAFARNRGAAKERGDSGFGGLLLVPGISPGAMVFPPVRAGPDINGPVSG